MQSNKQDQLKQDWLQCVCDYLYSSDSRRHRFAAGQDHPERGAVAEDTEGIAEVFGE